MKLILLLVLVCLIQLDRAAPFAKKTIAAYVLKGTDCFIYEFDISGTKVQEIALTAGLTCSAGTPLITRLDVTSSLLIVPLMTNTDNVLVAYNPNGDIQHTTTIPKSSLTAFAGLVSGNDFWVQTGNAVAYTTSGSTGAPTNANILPAPSGPGYSISNPAQLVGTVLYFSNSFQSNTFKMDPVVKTTGTISNFAPNTKFYFHNDSTLYMHTGVAYQKYTVQNGVATLAYSASSTVYPDYISTVEVDGTVYVLCQALVQTGTTSVIVRATDTGSTFNDETTIVSSSTFRIRFATASPVASCTDGIKDQDETDIDCGGAACSKCAVDKSCSLDKDCTSGYCNSNNVCATPTCVDSVKNQDETDVDCGGAKCNKCADGKGCKVAGDCTSGVCDAGTCAVPTCIDGVQNQGESDIDCGGSECSKCADGKLCTGGGECLSGVCDSGTCSAPSCEDNVMNGVETDVDCGGNTCSGCAIDKKCSLNSDCAGNKCLSNLCAASCQDNILNQDETDIDCGGPNCGGCADDKTCSNDGDCQNGFCNPDSNVCKTPTCQDTYQNQDETDIDCGGSTCTKCAVDKACIANSDCLSNNCVSKACANPPAAPQPIDTPVNAPVDGPQPVESPVSSSPSGNQAPGSNSPVSSTPIKQKPVSASSVMEMSVLGLLSLVVIFA